MDNSYTIVGYEDSASAFLRIPAVLQQTFTELLEHHEIEILGWSINKDIQMATASLQMHGLEYDMQCDLNTKKWPFSLRVYGAITSSWEQWDRHFVDGKLVDTELSSSDEPKISLFTADDFQIAKVAALKGIVYAD